MINKFDISAFDVAKYDGILMRGLSYTLGTAGGQVCIEAAICETLGMAHGDDPGCVATTVREFKIALNDCGWSSPAARAKGLRDLGLAQLGSKGVVNDGEFTKRLVKKTIRVLIPRLFRAVAKGKKKLLQVADDCENAGTQESAAAADAAAYTAAASAAYIAAYAAYTAASTAAYYASYASAASAASYASYAASSLGWGIKTNTTVSDSYLELSASLALEVLRELHSPGCALLVP